MPKKENREAQTVRFMKWTKKYNGWWQLICESDNEHMNIQMMQMLIKRLAKEEFYEIIFGSTPKSVLDRNIIKQ